MELGKNFNFGQLLHFCRDLEIRVSTYSRWVLIWGWAIIKFSPFSASVVCLFCNKTINAIKKKHEEVTKQGFCKILWRKLSPQGRLSLVLIQFQFQFQSHCHSVDEGGGGRFFEAGRLLTFSAFRMGAYSRWALIRGWTLIWINAVVKVVDCGKERM